MSENSNKDFYKFLVPCILALLFIAAIYITSCFVPHCKLDNLVVALIAAVASMVVIGNFSQVSEIKNEMKKENDNIIGKFEEYKKDMESKLNEQNKKIDDLKRKVDEAMNILNKEKEQIIEKNDRELINNYLIKDRRQDIEIKKKINTGVIYRYYLAGDKDNNAIIIKAGFKEAEIIEEEDYLNRWDNKKEREKESSNLAQFKDKYGLK